MSAYGPEQTWVSALHRSALWGKVDMAICGMSAFAVAIRGKADVAFCDACSSLAQGPLSKPMNTRVPALGKVVALPDKRHVGFY